MTKINPYKILFKYASRSRPQNFFRGLDSIVNNLSDKENYHIQITLDSDDHTMNTVSVRDRIASYSNTSVFFGTSKNKIDAINRDRKKFPDDWQILINFSDDQIFTKKGFDDIIRSEMQKHFPDLDGFLHFHDGNQPRLATMSIIGKKHYDRTGYIYNPDYISVYCDNHAQEYAQALGKYKYMGDKVNIMMHIHPLHGHKVEFDAQYNKTEDRKIYLKDKETYRKYKMNNFGL